MTENVAPTAGMARLRRNLGDWFQRNTAANPAGNRLMALIALRMLSPKPPLYHKLSNCGRRYGSHGSRRLCWHPACAICMRRRGKILFRKRLWPALKDARPEDLRWVTVLMFTDPDLDQGASEMIRQHRRLQYRLKKFAAQTAGVRVFGCREVERVEDGWLFHVHMLLDVGYSRPDVLAEHLRTAWSGSRQIQIKPLQPGSLRKNVYRLAMYMTKVRYTQGMDGERRWLDYPDIAALVLWRNRVPAQWHRFTLGVRAGLSV